MPQIACSPLAFLPLVMVQVLIFDPSAAQGPNDGSHRDRDTGQRLGGLARCCAGRYVRARPPTVAFALAHPILFAKEIAGGGQPPAGTPAAHAYIFSHRPVSRPPPAPKKQPRRPAKWKGRERVGQRPGPRAGSRQEGAQKTRRQPPATPTLAPQAPERNATVGPRHRQEGSGPFRSFRCDHDGR
jgi:hypothetical protein